MEWISVKEKLPDVDGKYLVARKESDRYSDFCSCGERKEGDD